MIVGTTVGKVLRVIRRSLFFWQKGRGRGEPLPPSTSAITEGFPLPPLLTFPTTSPFANLNYQTPFAMYYPDANASCNNTFYRAEHAHTEPLFLHSDDEIEECSGMIDEDPIAIVNTHTTWVEYLVIDSGYTGRLLPRVTKQEKEQEVAILSDIQCIYDRLDHIWWTRHPEDIPEFATVLTEAISTFLGVVILKLERAYGPEDDDALAEVIKERVDELGLLGYCPGLDHTQIFRIEYQRAYVIVTIDTP